MRLPADERLWRITHGKYAIVDAVMPHTYKAILKGDRVQWIGDAPDTNGGVPVQITVLERPQPCDEATRSQQIRDALNALVESGAATAFGDPAEWQREIRKDRPLPGRED